MVFVEASIACAIAVTPLVSVVTFAEIAPAFDTVVREFERSTMASAVSVVTLVLLGSVTVALAKMLPPGSTVILLTVVELVPEIRIAVAVPPSEPETDAAILPLPLVTLAL